MTVKQFECWLINNEFNQSTLAEKLGINRQTITGYKNNQNFPKLFIFALRGLEHADK